MRWSDRGTQYNTDGLSITSDMLNFYIEFRYTRQFHIFRNCRSHKSHDNNFLKTVTR